MRRSSIIAALALALAIAAVLCGCGDLQVKLSGSVEPHRNVPPEARDRSDLDRTPLFVLEVLGDPVLHAGEVRVPLRVASARETERFGLKAIDTGDLPRVWRPGRTERGAVVVADLKSASPLAVAGLRPYDEVRAVNGARVADPAALVRELRAAAEGKTVRLSIHRQGDTPGLHEIVARPEGRVADASEVYVPFVVERRSSRTGRALAVGPLDSLFWYRAAIRDEADTKLSPDHSAAKELFGWATTKEEGGYFDRFEWAALLNLVQYKRDREVGLHAGPGATHELRLFWLFHFYW